MNPINSTTVTATTAGGAFGTLVAWGLGQATGTEISVEVGGLFATCGAFAFGLFFPTR